jgi:2-iminobutanoate/2-iminopropanoate deaminase
MTHPLVSYPQLSDTPTSHLPFSPCVVVGDLIFVSGQASVDAEGQHRQRHL